jgi:hypothetical protein
MSAPRRADAFALWWVDRYTATLADAVAERRRDEICSDLWEQRAAAARAAVPSTLVGLSVLRRVVAGIAADLSWRRGQLAAARGRSPAHARRLWWTVRRSWWQALAAVLGVIEVATAVSIPLEGASTAGPGHIVLLAASGILVLAGLAQRPIHRQRGGVMIAIGVLAVLDWYWTYVIPIAAITVIAAALVDAADARPAPPHDSTRDGGRARTGLVIALASVLGGAAFTGSAELGIVFVSPVLAALVAHAVVRRHRNRSTASRLGGLAIATGLGNVACIAVAVAVSTGVELRMPAGAPVVVMSVSVLAVVGGGLLLVIDRRRASAAPR